MPSKQNKWSIYTQKLILSIKEWKNKSQKNITQHKTDVKINTKNLKDRTFGLWKIRFKFWKNI